MDCNLKATLALKPEKRLKWLTQALSALKNGSVRVSDVFDIIWNPKFINGVPEGLGKKMRRSLNADINLFSAKQQQSLEKSEFFKRFPLEESKPKEVQQVNESAMDDMMARCRAFVRENETLWESRKQELDAAEERRQREAEEKLRAEEEARLAEEKRLEDEKQKAEEDRLAEEQRCAAKDQIEEGKEVIETAPLNTDIALAKLEADLAEVGEVSSQPNARQSHEDRSRKRSRDKSRDHSRKRSRDHSRRGGRRRSRSRKERRGKSRETSRSRRSQDKSRSRARRR